MKAFIILNNAISLIDDYYPSLALFTQQQYYNKVTKLQVLEVQITSPHRAAVAHGILFLFPAKKINPQSGGTYAPFQRRGVVYLLTPPCRGLRVSVSRCLEWRCTGKHHYISHVPSCKSRVVKHVLTRPDIIFFSRETRAMGLDLSYLCVYVRYGIFPRFFTGGACIFHLVWGMVWSSRLNQRGF